VGGQRHAPAVLPPEKTRYPLYRRLGGLQGQSGHVRKISPPPGIDPRNVQPVVSCYTNWATRPTLILVTQTNKVSNTCITILTNTCRANSHRVHTDIFSFLYPAIPNFMDVTGIRRLFVFILCRRHRLGPIRIGFVVDKPIMRQAFYQIFRIFPLSIILPIFHTNSIVSCRRWKLSVVESVVE
jgi:hypothetical protein